MTPQSWSTIAGRIKAATCAADIYNIEGEIPEDLRQYAERRLDELSGPYAGSS